LLAPPGDVSAIRNCWLEGLYPAHAQIRILLPTTGKVVPAGPDWYHEIKYDGFRLRVQRNGDCVRLITRGGYDWSKRYPWIVEAAQKNRYKQFVTDDEASSSALEFDAAQAQSLEPPST
jgi:ATP-dependent DNA ligase